MPGGSSLSTLGLYITIILFVVAVGAAFGLRAWIRRYLTRRPILPDEPAPIQWKGKEYLIFSFMRVALFRKIKRPVWLRVSVALIDFGFGVLLIFFGQSLISQAGENTSQVSRWLNDSFHLGINNLDNILVGLPLLWAGCFFIIRLLLRLKLFAKEKETEPSPSGTLPFGFLYRQLGWGAVGSLLFLILLILLTDKQYSGLMIFLWLAALTLFAIWVWKCDRRAGVTLSPNLTRKDLLWMIGLVLVGLVIVSYQLQDLPNQMMGDEGTFWTTARDIANGKYQPPVFGLGVYTFGVLSSIVQGIVLKLFGISFWSWRFSSVLAGVAAVPPLYLLSRELFNRKVAVASCAALLSAPYFLAFARLGYNNIQAVFVVTLACYLFYLGYKRNSVFYLFLGGCAAGLGVYTYSAANGAFYVILLFLACGLLYRLHRWRLLAKTGMIVAVGWFLVSSPLITYASAFDPTTLRYKPLESAFFNEGYGTSIFSTDQTFLNATRFDIDKITLFFSPELYATMLFRGTFRSLIAFNSPFLVNEHFIASPLAGPVAVLFFMVGSFFALVSFRQKRFLLLLLWFGLNLLVFSVANTFPPRHQHLVGILPVIAIFIGLGMVIFIDLIAGLFPRLRGRAQSWFLGLLVLGIGASGLYNYFVTMPERYLPSFEQNVNWNALYSQNQTIYYLYTSSQRPDTKPYILSEVRQDVAYKAILIDDFVTHPEMYPLPQNVLIFYSNLSILSHDVFPVLSETYGLQAHERSFYNWEGEPIGQMAWIGAQPDILPAGAVETLLDSYNRPSVWLLIALAAIFAFCAVFRRVWLKRVPTWLAAAVEGITRPALEPERQRMDSKEPLFGEMNPRTLKPALCAASKSPKEGEISPQAAQPAYAESLQPAGLLQATGSDAPVPVEQRSLPPYVNSPVEVDPKVETGRPFIEFEFRLRVNLPSRQSDHRFGIPSSARKHTGPGAAVPGWQRLSEHIFIFENRTVNVLHAFLAQNGWFPGFMVLLAVSLAVFGQIDLIHHTGPEPGIWYLLFGGFVFGLFSFSTRYAIPLPARPEQAGEYLLPTAALRVRLASAAFFIALANLFFLQKHTPSPEWDIFANWVVSIVLFLLAFLPRPHFKRPVLNLKKNWQTLLPLGIILLAGFALRFYQLGAIPPIMENDEGRVGMQAVDVLNGTLPYMFRTAGGSGTLLFFMMALPVKLLGQTILAIRLNTAILGLLTLPLIFLLARQMFGRRVALVSTALLAVAHLHFHFSRISPLVGSLDPLLTALTMALVYRGVQSRRAIDWALAGTVMGLGLYFYVGARVQIFILVGFLILLLIFNRRVLRENWRNLLVLAGAYLVIAAPMLLWANIDPGAFNARANQVGIFQNGWLDHEMVSQNISAIVVLAQQLANSFLIFNYHYPAWFYNAQVPGLGPVTGAAFVFGILAAFPRLRDPRFALLSSWFWVTLILGQVLVVDPAANAYRTLGLIPAVCIVAALALVCLTEAVFERWPRISKVVPVVILSLALIFETGWNTWNYFAVWAPQNRYSDYNSRLASLIGEYLGEQPAGTQAYVAATTDFQPSNWYALDYLRKSTPVVDLDRPLADVVTDLKLGAHTVFILPKERQSELAALQAALPDGQVIKKYLGGELYFTAYYK